MVKLFEGVIQILDLPKVEVNADELLEKIFKPEYYIIAAAFLRITKLTIMSIMVSVLTILLFTIVSAGYYLKEITNFLAAEEYSSNEQMVNEYLNQVNEHDQLVPMRGLSPSSDEQPLHNLTQPNLAHQVHHQQSSHLNMSDVNPCKTLNLRNVDNETSVNKVRVVSPSSSSQFQIAKPVAAVSNQANYFNQNTTVKKTSETDNNQIMATTSAFRPPADVLSKENITASLGPAPNILNSPNSITTASYRLQDPIINNSFLPNEPGSDINIKTPETELTSQVISPENMPAINYLNGHDNPNISNSQSDEIKNINHTFFYMPSMAPSLHNAHQPNLSLNTPGLNPSTLINSSSLNQALPMSSFNSTMQGLAGTHQNKLNHVSINSQTKVIHSPESINHLPTVDLNRTPINYPEVIKDDRPRPLRTYPVKKMSRSNSRDNILRSRPSSRNGMR